MPRNADLIRLRHMLDAASEAAEDVRGKSWEDFQHNRLLQRGVIYAITVIGEAGTRISEAYQKRHPEVPWREVIGMRNRLIHAYFDINVALVWKTVQEIIPPFILMLEGLIQEEEEQLRLPEQ